MAQLMKAFTQAHEEENSIPISDEETEGQKGKCLPKVVLSLGGIDKMRMWGLCTQNWGGPLPGVPIAPGHIVSGA